MKKRWNIKVSIESIRQVLIEDGFIEERIKMGGISQQKDIFEDNGTKQIEIEYLSETDRMPGVTEQIESAIGNRGKDVKDDERKGLRHYSSTERLYLDRLEQGEYNVYAGGLLLNPLLAQYNYLSTIKRTINIETYEGYCLEQLCLSLLYFDVFGFESIENFKTVYPEEFGVLISKLNSPSIFTLRRFLHKVKELKKGEELIEEFGKEYLKSGLVNCKVLYIDDTIFYPIMEPG